MQVEGRTFDFWRAECFKASIAQVSSISIYVITGSLAGSVFPITSICRLSEAWHSKRPLLVDGVKFLLDEKNLGVRKALSEVGCYELIDLEFLLFLKIILKILVSD